MFPESKILKDRAKMFEKVRSFFSKKNILEVDCPIITKAASIDAFIDVMETRVFTREKGFLHTSPEYFMKRLLSKKMKDIYYMGHVFRKSEIGDFHNPEFVLVEWYRKNFSYKNFILEIMEFISLFLPKISFEEISYKNFFLKYANIDYEKISVKELLKFLKKDFVSISLDKDDLLNLLLDDLLKYNNKLLVIKDFPSSQAALAKVVKIGKRKVARRFEIFYKKIELANGYFESNNKKEIKKRFKIANKKRRKKLFLDQKFLDSLKNLPSCYGVAVGFDRLFMLKHKKKKVSDIMPFFWQNL